MTLECLPEKIRKSLQTVIRDHNFSSIAVVDVTKSANAEIGCSCNVKIAENGKELKLFVKYLNETKSEFSEEAVSYFGNEVVFYSDVLTQLEDLIKITGKRKHLTFAPVCLDVGSVSEEQQPFIIMEDLLSQGFAPLDIRGPVSVERAQEILDQLGRFHALSFAVRDKRGGAFEAATSRFRETVFREETRSNVGKIFVRSIHDAYKLAKQSFPPGSEYVDKFASFMLNIFDKMIAWIQGDAEDKIYKVLTHGDLWPTNVLCRSDVGPFNPGSSVRFIDYQACRLSSPAHDLQLFLLVALDRPTRDQHRSQLIRHYHMSLCRALQDLGCDPLMLFPYSALLEQLRKYSKFALAVALAGLPLYLHEGEILGMKRTCEGGDDNVGALLDFVNTVQTSKSMRCKNKMLEVIVDVVNQGYL